MLRKYLAIGAAGFLGAGLAMPFWFLAVVILVALTFSSGWTAAGVFWGVFVFSHLVRRHWRRQSRELADRELWVRGVHPLDQTPEAYERRRQEVLHRR